MAFNTTFNNHFSYIMAVSFLGVETRRTKRKTPTCRKSLINFITLKVVSSNSAMSGIRTHNFSGDRH